MTTAFPEELTAAASGQIPLPGPETVTGLPQLPVAVALMTAWISGVALLVTQTASAMPLGARAKYTAPRLVSLADTITGGDHALLLMEPLTARACDVEKPMDLS